MFMEEYKQVLVLRKDLELSKGKAAAQCAHASLEAFHLANPGQKKKWQESGQKKVVLYSKNQDELLAIAQKSKKMKLPCAVIIDAGRTEIEAGTITCVGIGPASEKEIDKVTGSLPLCD